MTAISRRIPELVAPAGSLDTFWAALESGADAVYMGFAEFSARKRARNFSQEEFRDAVLVAHRRGKRVYAALNTLLFDRELPDFINAASFLSEIGVDAVILQDLGALHLLRRLFPSLRVHASTQMFCHNSQQARFLKDAGASRIVLARELSISEIALVARKVPLEYEIFVHGALCFAFSGCCLFSARLFGESGNRGECRQPCRLRLSEGPAPYPFSMKDLNAAPALESLLALEPAALKIEGRLRNPAYVSAIVSYYRSALDAYAQNRPLPPSGFEPGIQRSTSSGYLSGKWNYSTLVDSQATGTLGRRVGCDVRFERGRVLFTSWKALNKGMRLRIQDTAGRNWIEGSLLAFHQTQKGKEFQVRWEHSKALPQNAPSDLAVFFIGMAGDSAAPAQIRNELRGLKPFSLEIDAVFEADKIRIRAADARLGFAWGKKFQQQVQVEKQLEMRKPEIETLFRETGETPFAVQEVRLEMDGANVWTFKELRSVRRTFFAEFAKLHEEHLRQTRATRNERLAAMLAEEAPAPVFPMDAVSLELSTEPMDPKALLCLPLFVPEEKLNKWHSRIRSLIEQGCRRWVLPTYGWLALFSEFKDLEIYCGPFFYAGNTPARQFLKIWKPAGIFNSADPNQSPSQPIDGPLLITRIRLPDSKWQYKDREITVKHCGDYDALFLT